MKHVFLAIFALVASSVFAQTGKIRGVVMNGAMGEPLMSATVAVAGTSNGAFTDFDGNYELEVDAGTISIQLSYMGYKTMTIEGVEVKAGEITVMDNITMEEDVEVFDQEIVVTADAITSTEASVINIKSKSVRMLDGVSAAQIGKAGDGNVAEATTRITGVTVEGGKYVYIRGLGDRYSKTMLNGVDIPGLDPDRNAIQMDIFPTNMVSNLMISKNFTVDMPADYTGGLLNVETKEFPEKKTLSVSFGTSYNPQYHFNPNFLSYQGGATDFLGFDDGTRKLPAAHNAVVVPTPYTPGVSTDQVTSFVKKFSPIMGAQEQMSILDLSAGISYGDQINLKNSGNKLGYIFSLSYKSSYQHYDDVKYGEYQRDIDANENELVLADERTGAISERNFLLGAFAGIAYKNAKSKYKLTAMHLQNGASKAAQFDIVNNAAAIGQSGYEAVSDNLEYNQRSLTNLLLSGSHFLNGKEWEIKWKLSPTYSISDDPDIRKTSFSYNPSNDSYAFKPGEAGNPSRIWRSLNEINAVAKADITKKFETEKLKFDLNFGASYTFKLRNYNIQLYELQFARPQSWASSDANQVLSDQNIYAADVANNGTYIQSGNSSPNVNEYSSNINNAAVYVSTEFKLFKRLRTIVGIRAEYFAMRHTGRDILFAQGGNGRNLVNEKVLESFKPFPSVNLVYNITPKMNLRAGYGRTVARPSFKELSFAQIIDPITNRIFNGGLFPFVENGVTVWDGNLMETDIDNVDLRWEYFLKDKAQFISFSGFYKNFANPIEMIRIPTSQTTAEYQPRNVGNGLVVGGEFEFKKNFDFITPALADLALNGNVTIAYSQIEMTDAEYNSRKLYEREGETINTTRDMAGQSPWVVNVGLSYSNADLGLNLGVFYNVKGPTLMIVGTGLIPDVYSEPFHSLNFNASKTFDKDQKTRLSFKVENMLNDRRESFFRSHNATSQVFNSYNPGFSFSIGLNHKFL